MEELHIRDRIDEVLNILNQGNFHGYEQWGPVVDSMRKLAAISQDVLKLEQEAAENEEHPAE